MSRTNRAAIVTGGAQGIGKAIARRLLREGVSVLLADVDAGAGRETAREFAELGRVAFLRADASKERDAVRAVRAAQRRFGRLDYLVNNAGIGVWKPIEEATLADWERIIGVNLTSVFLWTKHAAPALRAARGAVVNISSTRAVMSEPNGEAYAASKGGVVGITHALAVSLGPAVRVNCILPGWIETCEWRKSSQRHPPKHSDADKAQHPCGRVGRPEDVAALAWFLLSPESGFITGASVLCDGGMTRRMIYV